MSSENSLVQVQRAQERDASLVEKFMVILVRPGVGGKKYMVPQGSTIGDLLQAAGVVMENQDIMIGETKVGTTQLLKPSEVIFMVPKPKNA